MVELSPLRSDSLVDLFVSKFEKLILSGQLSIGERLPSERDLAEKMNVSRPVVHEGLVELQAKGLVALLPRKGAFINDYRKNGSLAMLESLLSYHDGNFEPSLLAGMLDLRALFETEIARLAALRRTTEQLTLLEEIVIRETACVPGDTETITELDFEFHLQLAVASGNSIYPLFMNSFKPVYTNLTGKFYRNPDVRKTVIAFHRNLVKAVRTKEQEKATAVMSKLLKHGETYLKQSMQKERSDD